MTDSSIQNEFNNVTSIKSVFIFSYPNRINTLNRLEIRTKYLMKQRESRSRNVYQTATLALVSRSSTPTRIMCAHKIYLHTIQVYVVYIVIRCCCYCTSCDANGNKMIISVASFRQRLYYYIEELN